MYQKKQDIDYFDDDFEVTYTEDLPDISIHIDDDYEDDYNDDYYEDDRDTEWDSDSYYEPEYPEEDDYRPRHRSSSRSRDRSSPRPRRGVELASPLRAPMRTGVTVIEKVTFTVLRLAPILLSGAILVLSGFVFWDGHSAFGEPASIAAEQNFTLAAYLIVGGVLLIWETGSFFFILGTNRSRTGRGLIYFITIYALSYIASIVGGLLPEGIEILDGIRGGIAMYGSLYPRLFPLCLLGIISCVVKKVLN